MKQARGRRQQSSGAESLRESSPSRSNCSCRKPYTPAAVPQTKHLNLYHFPHSLPYSPTPILLVLPRHAKPIPETARRGTFRGISPIFRTRHAKKPLKLHVVAHFAAFSQIPGHDTQQRLSHCASWYLPQVVLPETCPSEVFPGCPSETF